MKSVTPPKQTAGLADTRARCCWLIWSGSLAGGLACLIAPAGFFFTNNNHAEPDQPVRQLLNFKGSVLSFEIQVVYLCPPPVALIGSGSKRLTPLPPPPSPARLLNASACL